MISWQGLATVKIAIRNNLIDIFTVAKLHPLIISGWSLATVKVVIRNDPMPGLEISEKRHLPCIAKIIDIYRKKIFFTRNIKIFTCPEAWGTRKYERTSAIFEPCMLKTSEIPM